MKKIAKIIGMGAAVLLAGGVVLLAGVFTNHSIKSSRELQKLKALGYYNPVSVGDYSLNVAVFGNPEGSHRIIGLAGLGSGDFSVAMRQMTSTLEKDNQIIFVDRAGYGFSDDTKKEMTLSYIVEDYRKALKNAGIKAPYILMPHSIGGAYATYWVSRYPEEIEAIVFVDGSELSADAFSDEPMERVDLWDHFLAGLGKLGFSRLVLRKYFYHYPDNYSEEEQELADALMYRTLDSIAPVSESAYLAENAQEAFGGIITNDVPKLYLCASWGFEDKDTYLEYCNWVRRQIEINHLKTDFAKKTPEEEVIAKVLEQYKELRETIIYPYAELMGNCEIKLLGGDHMIYEQKPEDCGRVVKEFIESRLRDRK